MQYVVVGVLSVSGGENGAAAAKEGAAEARESVKMQKERRIRTMWETGMRLGGR